MAPTLPASTSPSHRFGGLVALGGFLALAVAWTWPLASHLTSRVPVDPGDPILNTWILWWNAHAVPFTDRWWNPPIFFPMRGALALSEHLAGIGLVTTPLQLAGASALTAYNVALILSFALSGFFAYVLGRRLTGSALAGCCAGIAFGFAPYRAGQLSHLQVLTSQWMPLALVAMHAYVDTARRRWLAVFSAAWLVQALSNGYYLLFFPVLVALWLAWFVDWRRAPQRGLALVAAWGLSSMLLVPVLLQYASVQHRLGLSRTPGDVLRFSGTLQAFARPGGMLAFWPSFPAETEEQYLFPGVTAIVLVVAGLAMRRRSPRSPLIFYAGAALVMWAFALGPAPPGSGAAILMHPYTLLTHLPGFDALRVPARFAMLGALCLAAAAGLAFARVMPERPTLRRALAAAVFAGLAMDGWMRDMPLILPPGRVILPDIPDASVVELPADEGIIGTTAMYRATQHRHPLVNGYSGHTPPHYRILSAALQRKDPSVLTELARSRPLLIIVNTRLDAGGDMRRLVDGLPGIQPRGGSGAGAIFLVPAQPAAQLAPTGAPWPAAIREGARYRADIDLGSVRTVRTIAFPLRWHYLELDTRLAVEASTDGTVWSTVWEDWTGGRALAATLEDPRDVPFRIMLPDVPARYLRIHPAASWLWNELKVFGP